MRAKTTDKCRKKSNVIPNTAESVCSVLKSLDDITLAVPLVTSTVENEPDIVKGRCALNQVSLFNKIYKKQL